MVGKERPAYTRVMERTTPGPNGCVEFRDSPVGGGYGRISDRNKPRKASRVVMEYHHGVSSLFVLHSCDNRCCVNIDHLRYGTQQENVEDAVRRKRLGKPTKLTSSQVRLIRSSGLSARHLADIHGVTHGYISMIRNGSRRDAA